jgi:hypothetical protein
MKTITSLNKLLAIASFSAASGLAACGNEPPQSEVATGNATESAGAQECLFARTDDANEGLRFLLELSTITDVSSLTESAETDAHLSTIAQELVNDDLGSNHQLSSEEVSELITDTRIGLIYGDFPDVTVKYTAFPGAEYAAFVEYWVTYDESAYVFVFDNDASGKLIARDGGYFEDGGAAAGVDFDLCTVMKGNEPADKGNPKCEYEGELFHAGQSFPSSDGCNTCTCGFGAVSCTEMACSQ